MRLALHQYEPAVAQEWLANLPPMVRGYKTDNEGIAFRDTCLTQGRCQFDYDRTKFRFTWYRGRACTQCKVCSEAASDTQRDPVTKQT